MRSAALRRRRACFLSSIAWLAACERQPAPAPAARGENIVSTSAASAAAGHACRQATDCSADEYCAFDPPLCSRGARPGTCQPRPRSCSSQKDPVCGCDGKLYDNACRASRAGVDRSLLEHCEQQPLDFIRCGDRYCDAKTSYCEIYLSDVLEPPSDYECKPLPASCLPNSSARAPACDCFPSDTPCLSFCGPLPTGGVPGFHLTCQGQRKPRTPPAPPK